MIRFILNEEEIEYDLQSGTVLLDFIRYHQHLTGTKIGCREGDCGACTILTGEIIDGKLRYRSATSCLMPMGNVHGKHIVTIEGINLENLNPIQQLMCDEGATQCGFCTPGFVMSLAGFCLSDKKATKENAIAAIDGNICRCTGYKSIEKAAFQLTTLLHNRGDNDPASFAASNNILPGYFSSIKERLIELSKKTTLESNHDLNNERLAGGGTDLYVQQHDVMTHSSIRFLFDVVELNGIRKEGNKCILGASVTVTDLCESTIILDSFPQFLKYAKLISSTPIRNMATLAGNFVNASPIGDFTIFFLVLDAIITLNDGTSKREMPLRKFYKGYKQLDKSPTEFIEQISFELPSTDSKFNFEKVSKRTHLDIASVNTAILLQCDGIKIINAGVSAGGIGPIPMYLEKTSTILKGKSISTETIQEALQIAQQEIKPISDARGTAAYKRLLLRQLMIAHFMTLFPDILNVEVLVSDEVIK